MKVFNLTDVSTKQLLQHQLVGHTVAVSNKLLGPGDMAVVEDNRSEMVRDGVAKLVSMGVLAIDKLPPAYVLAKAEQQKAGPPPAPPAGKPSTPPKSSKPKDA